MTCTVLEASRLPACLLLAVEGQLIIIVRIRPHSHSMEVMPGIVQRRGVEIRSILVSQDTCLQLQRRHLRLLPCSLPHHLLDRATILLPCHLVPHHRIRHPRGESQRLPTEGTNPPLRMPRLPVELTDNHLLLPLVTSPMDSKLRNTVPTVKG